MLIFLSLGTYISYNHTSIIKWILAKDSFSKAVSNIFVFKDIHRIQSYTQFYKKILFHTSEKVVKSFCFHGHTSHTIIQQSSKASFPKILFQKLSAIFLT